MSLNRLRQLSKYSNPVLVDKFTDLQTGSVSKNYWTGAPNLGLVKTTYDEHDYLPYKPPKERHKLTVGEKLRMKENRKLRPFVISSSICDESTESHFFAQDSVPGLYSLGFDLSGHVAAFDDIGRDLTPDFVFKKEDQRWFDYVLAKAASKRYTPIHDTMVTLGELAETVRMLVSPVNGLLRLSVKHRLDGVAFKRVMLKMDGGKRTTGVLFTNQMRRLGFKGVKRFGQRVIDETCDKWLSYQFGVKPFLYEISTLTKFAKSNDPSIATQCARTGLELPIAKSEKQTYGVDIHFYRFDQFEKTETKMKVSAGVYFSQDLSFPTYNWLKSAGLNLENIPSTVWELVPLSFVIDRFVDISSYIRNLCPTLDVITKGNFVSLKQETFYERLLKPSWYNAYNKPRLYGVPCYYSLLEQKLKRQVYLPIPDYPVFNPRLLNITQHVDHLTLLCQRLPKWR